MAAQEVPKYSKEEIDLISLEAIQKLQATYKPGRNREITAQNVFQDAILEGRADFEEFVLKFLLPDSRMEGLENITDCLDKISQGKSVILLPEHRSNFDAPAFHVLLRRKGAEYADFLPRLVYIAGRKLNESSDLVNMFSEKYSRLVIVPRRDLPDSKPGETEEEAEAREAYVQQAARINRAAFREMIRLKKAGKVFVLFPMGGRLKPGADNIPVRETTSYLKTFDVAYLVNSKEEIDLISLEAIQKLQATYKPGRNREITAQNVFQDAILEGRADFEEFVLKFLLPDSRMEGLENITDCLDKISQGKSVILLPEHRSNFDAPAFHVLLRRKGAEYADFLPRLVYIAGRKLNESSDLVNMFSEKYSRLVIVPRRDLPDSKPGETEEEAEAREAYVQQAARINRAAFREMIRLKKAGKVFVLFPMGGRLKPGADNIPVRETTSYLKTFDVAYLVSMDGNTLHPRPKMEDERPNQDTIVFRVGRALDTKSFLAEQREIFDSAYAAEKPPPDIDFEQFAVERIMRMLDSLRTEGDFGTSFSA